MFENILNFFKKLGKNENKETSGSKTKAKERLHLVLMQDRANVSADFLEMMKQEIIDVIKKYIDVDETDMDVKLENRVNDDGTSGAPALYANIPILGINEDKKKESNERTKAKQAELEEEQKAEKEVKKTTRKTTKTASDKKKAVSAKKSTTKKETTAKAKVAKVVKAASTGAKRGRKPKAKDEETN